MKGRKIRMTPAWVASVRSEAAPVEWRDLVERGLVLRVEASGLRSWAVRYTVAGEDRRYRLGPCPTLSLAAARAAARRALREVAAGDDPQAERAKVRLGETFAEVADNWLGSEDTRHWRPRSREGFETHLQLRLLPKLGPMKLASIQRAHVRAVLDGIDRRVTRNRTFEVARMMFSWAVGRELLVASPCAGITKLRERERSRTLTDEEIRQVVGAFDQTRLGRYVRLLFLTATRRDEALAVRWADIDLDRAVWTVPPEMEKSGEVRAGARVIALSSAALMVLAEQREHNMGRGLARSAYVFPGEGGGRLDRQAPKPVIYSLKGLRENGTSPSTHKLAKPRPALIPEDFRLHDLRRTVADRMVNDLSVSAYVVDVGVLGHAKPKLFGTYAPGVPLKDLRAAMETWAGALAAILSEAAAKKDAR